MNPRHTPLGKSWTKFSSISLMACAVAFLPAPLHADTSKLQAPALWVSHAIAVGSPRLALPASIPEPPSLLVLGVALISMGISYKWMSNR